MTTTFLNKKGNNNTNFDFTSYNFIKSFTDDNKKKNDNYIDNLITKAIKNITPWVKTKDDKNMINVIFGDKPLKKYMFEKPNYTLTSITPMILNLEWNKAASYLMEYLYYTNNPTYDFIIDNTPIKIHGNYIQVGADIIPTFTNSTFFDDMKKEDQINIYNIAIEINAIFAA